MSGITGVSMLNAITGATQTTYHAGVHSEINVKGHVIETGIDYVRFLRNLQSYPRLIVKAVLSLGYAFSRSLKDFGNLPDYKFTNWNIGPTLGFAVNFF